MKQVFENRFENRTEWINAVGQLHREDGPAIEWADGTKFWYLNGKRHREDGPAIEWADGTKFWYLNDKRHREDGPAEEWVNGTKFWYLNGEFIRKEVPKDPDKFYIDGHEVSEQEYNVITFVRKRPPLECNPLATWVNKISDPLGLFE